MKCPTMEIDTGGQKVVINVADFDSSTMIKWVYSVGIEGAGKVHPPAPEFKFSPKSKG